MAPRKGKRVSALKVHISQQGSKATVPAKTKLKIKKAVERKKRGNVKVFKDKKLIIEETQSDNVTIVSLTKGSEKKETFQDGLELKLKKGRFKNDGEKVVKPNKQRKMGRKPVEKNTCTEFVVVADSADVMLVEAQDGNNRKVINAGENLNCKESKQRFIDTESNKRKSRRRKKRKNDSEILDPNSGNKGIQSAEITDSSLSCDISHVEMSKGCFSTHEMQRNPPKFESEFVKKNYDKNLGKEIRLDKEQVEVRRKTLEEMYGSMERDMIDVQSNDDSFVLEEADGTLEESVSESEDGAVSDFDGEDVSAEDIVESLEQQEALFKIFGHDQAELGSCGAFGSNSTSFQFHGQDGLPEKKQRLSELNDSGFSNDMKSSTANTLSKHSLTTDGDPGEKKIKNGGLRRKRSKKQKSKTVASGNNDPKMSAKAATKDDNITPKMNCISLSLPDEEAAVVVLVHPQELCIQGKASVTMVTGEMSIMGHRLQPGKSYQVYSPLSNSYVVLSTVDGDDNVKDLSQKMSGLLRCQDSDEQIRKLKAFQGEHCVTFVVRPLDSEAHNYISSMSPYNGLFSIRSDEPLAHNKQLLPLGVGLFPREYVMRPWITISKDVRQILDLWETMVARGDKSATGRAPVILVCGGKNSGKSTLNRHLINSALNSLKDVSYLELDVGQTEFSPPGCVSLYNVTEPVLGPPFTHLRKAERMCYYGGMTAGMNVSLYTRCVEYVFAAHRGDNPLIVNTMGWNKGIGLKLLVDILHITNPDIVVQINTYKSTDNFPPITPLFKMEEEGWLHNSWDQQQMQDMVNETDAGDHELCVLQTPVRKMQEKFITWTAADHRNVTLLSYFCDGLRPGQTLLSLAPYTVPWTAVAIHVCSSAGIQPSQTLLVLNGSIVGLCQAEQEGTAPDENYPRLLTTFPMCQCLGFGLVRGIDPETKLLHIVTPMTLDDLAKVNVLVKGSLMLPEQVSKQQKTNQQRPYWDNLTQSLGSWKTTYKDRKMRRPGAAFRSRHQ